MMKSMSETLKELIANRKDFNFSIERNGEIIGRISGLPVENSDYINLLTSNPEPLTGDYLIDDNGKRYYVSDIKKKSKMKTVYYTLDF